MQVITIEQSERSSYWQSYIGYLDDIHTALKPLKNSEKVKINFHDNFRTITESFKTNNERSSIIPTVTLFDGLFIGNY